MKTKILGTGFSGMVGSRIVEKLWEKYDFENLSLEKGIDITDRQRVFEKVNQFKGEWVLHLAAKAGVDDCEKDKELGKDGDAWKVNVLGTQNLADSCSATEKKIIYVSTDFVFDGENPPTDGYSEEDTPNPINWYARTKYEGERIVQKMGGNWLICRLAFPYRAKFVPKKDFVRAILSLLEKKEKVEAVSDQVITPTFIDDIANALDRLMEAHAQGIYHVVGSQSLTPYEATRLIAQKFDQDENLIVGVKRQNYFAGRAERPFKLVLRNDNIEKLGVRMRTFSEGLEEVERQLKARDL